MVPPTFLRLRATALAVLAAVMLFCSPGGAHAQEDNLDAEARANFEAGRIAFSAARFADALPYFERAYELSRRPELLYNVGMCHDRLGHDAEALEALEAYLAELPEAENRAEVEQRIATARARVARAALPSAPRAAGDGSDPTGWILVGTGAALAVGGAIVLGVGRSDVGAVEASMGTLSWTAASEAVGRGDALTVAGSVGLGLGVGLAALGLGLALSSGSSQEGSVALQFGPTSVAISGAF
jgi:tetratricopeptide (TPR) repeat protein